MNNQYNEWKKCVSDSLTVFHLVCLFYDIMDALAYFWRALDVRFNVCFTPAHSKLFTHSRFSVVKFPLLRGLQPFSCLLYLTPELFSIKYYFCIYMYCLFYRRVFPLLSYPTNINSSRKWIYTWYSRIINYTYCLKELLVIFHVESLWLMKIFHIRLVYFVIVNNVYVWIKKQAILIVHKRFIYCIF